MKAIKIFTLKNSGKLIFATSFLFFLILSCGNKTDKAAVDSKYPTLTNGEQKTTSSNNCLEPFHGKPENILTKKMVAKYVDFQGAEVESKTLAETLKQTKLSKGYIDMANIQFKWKINREKSSVMLGSIHKITLHKSKTPIDRFYAKYHTRSPKEQAALKKSYDSLVLNSKEVKQKTDKSNAKMLSEAIGFNFGYLKIDGIGDAAVWEHKVNGLKVLVGDYQFTVAVDLNKGNDHNLEKAKLIAKAIIDKACN